MSVDAIVKRALPKQRGEVSVLDDLDLEIRRGLGYLVPNRAGKTTTICLCSGCRSRHRGVGCQVFESATRATRSRYIAGWRSAQARRTSGRS